MNPNFPAEITNMVMVYDKQRGMVVIEDRSRRTCRGWCP